MPKYSIECVEDAYTEIVTMLGVSEDVFWYCDIPFVKRVADNKLLYQNWLSDKKEEVRENGR